MARTALHVNLVKPLVQGNPRSPARVHKRIDREAGMQKTQIQTKPPRAMPLISQSQVGQGPPLLACIRSNRDISSPQHRLFATSNQADCPRQHLGKPLTGHEKISCTRMSSKRSLHRETVLFGSHAESFGLRKCGSHHLCSPPS